jgi:hypothetical protein
VKQPRDISLMPPRKRPTTKDDDDEEDWENLARERCSAECISNRPYSRSEVIHRAGDESIFLAFERERPRIVNNFAASAGCFSASIALRTAAMPLVTPVEVSL